uniref:Uncharacterized protein n=1 Tax=Strix occidentalis caurina TaxID=311401 RepID=A0A8D0KSI4_STROC
MFISVARSGWLEGSVSMSSLQFHFLQTLEHRTDVSVTSTPPWWEAREERGALLFPKTRKCVQPSSAAFIVETNLK